MKFRAALILVLIAPLLVRCQNANVPTVARTSTTSTVAVTSTASPTSDSSLFLTRYVFPTSIDPAKRYIFYLHGKIIEDQGIPAFSPDYGEYEYEAILAKLASHGFTIISEQRAKNTDGMKYANRVSEQVRQLLNAGVPAENITVVGASKGASIVIAISSFLENKELNFVLLGTCNPETIQFSKQQTLVLYGNILTIRDTSDNLSGSCKELLADSTGKGLGKHKEVFLHIGTGHGILYQPLDEWIAPTVAWALGHTLSTEEIAILDSLEKVDDYPLYTMHYSGPYSLSSLPYEIPDQLMMTVTPNSSACGGNWGCSLFASLGDEKNRIYGRNFDWRFSPALLLFNDPPEGYASVSMVDIRYLGFEGDLVKNLTELPLEERRALLDTPHLPFDGMNEKGLAIGMAAVTGEKMPYNPQKKTIDQLGIMREILDHAATVDEAIEVMGSYNIDMGSVPIHYLIASASGDAAVVEFYQGKMVVFRNESPWQTATNFLLAATNGKYQGQCWRYDLIQQRLQEFEGKISSEAALHLLEDVSQNNTQWSVLYSMTSGYFHVIMGRSYSGYAHTFHLDQAAP